MKLQVKGKLAPDEYADVYDYFGLPYTSSSAVLDALANTEELVDLMIYSDGGNVIAGNEIYSAISAYRGSTTAKVGWNGGISRFSHRYGSRQSANDDSSQLDISSRQYARSW